MPTEPKFWNADMTESNGQTSWFGALSPRRRIMYVLILLFVVSWCFFLGFSTAGALEMAKAEAMEETRYSISGADLNTEEDSFEAVELSGFRTILAVGYDVREGYEVGRSDTIMVVFLNLDDKTVKLLSIPRDSYVQIPGHGKTKINHAYGDGGITMVKETVEYLLGITIDDYVTIDFKGFAEVVDAVGGVELYVDMDMINWDEGIEIYEGRHNLDGVDALGFCRYRGADCSDYDRIKHQQYFLRSLLDKLLSFSSLSKVTELVNIFEDNVTTTIGRTDMLQLAQYAFSMDLAGMEVYTVPGYSMYLQYGGLWLSHEIINQSELTVILTKLAGDDIVFSPNVISDGGLGSYSIPEGEDEMTDDPMMNGGEGEGGADDPSLTDPGATQPPVNDPSVSDPSVTDPPAGEPGAEEIDPNTGLPVSWSQGGAPNTTDPSAGGQSDQPLDPSTIPEPEE